MTGDASLRASLGLQGRVAIVTGGGNGMARATAHRLAEAGCDVSVVDFDHQAAQRTVAEIEERGQRGIAVHADLTDSAAPARMVAETVAGLGTPSVAVNFCGGTAGVQKPFLDITAEEWQRPLALNLTSTFLSAQAEAIAMIRAGLTGTIVTVASTSGITSAPNLAGYGAANAGVIHLTSTMAVELAPFGVRVNCVVPGTHWTPGTRRLAESEDAAPEVRDFFRKAAAAAPLGRLGEAAETSGVALFLASELSSYMTGHHVISDGGVLNTTARPTFGGFTVPDAVRDAIAKREGLSSV